ncbi:MAG: D-amino acid dehydrogenase [Thiohalocapsa sp.]|nr:D-amino acid dehydrogenase [Thiohalocapsa sp.]
MHVIVIGGGVIGTTSAYYLRRLGHDVSVIERRGGAGLETSYANAGQISPGYAAPWAAPGVPWKAVKWLLSQHSPLIIGRRPDGPMLRFILSMLANCTAQRYAVNKERMLRIAEYSRRAFGELRQDTGIEYDQRSLGTLQLFRTERQVEHAYRDMAILEQMDVPHALLGPDGCIASEPALERVRNKFAGGLRLPLDETGDCFAFTDALGAIAADAGVTFRFGTQVRAFARQHGRIVGIDTDDGRLDADAYVVALGSYSPQLLHPLDIHLPIYPVKGYSLTLPITDPGAAPRSTVMDETYKVAVTRLGDRIRVAGTAELAGYDLSLPDKRRGTVTHVVSDLFPDAGDPGGAAFWAGLRPMTPDGTPVIGPTHYPNLFLNTGHGTLGWTMSCGSARLVADLVSGNEPEIAMSGLTVHRYGD